MWAWNFACSKILMYFKYDKNVVENKFIAKMTFHLQSQWRTLPPTDGDFIHRIISMLVVDGMLSCIILSLKVKSYLGGFYKFLKRWGIIEVIVSRTIIWSRCQDAKCDIAMRIWRKTVDERDVILWKNSNLHKIQIIPFETVSL